MVGRRLYFSPLLRVLYRARRMGLWPELKPLLRDRLFPGRVESTKEWHSSSTALFQMATGYWGYGECCVNVVLRSSDGL